MKSVTTKARGTGRKRRVRRGAAAVAANGANGTADCYVEVELGRTAFRAVQKLARAAGCTPFEMCLKLVAEELSWRRSGGGRAV